MSAHNSKPIRWSNTQSYSLAVICLIAGVAFGYLFHGSAAATVKNTPAQSAITGAPGQGAAIAPQAASQQMQQVTPAQMRSMADKTAQPLLEQLKQHPNDADLMARIGSVYGAGHQFDIAEQYFTQAIKVKPTASDYAGLAEMITLPARMTNPWRA